MEPETVQQAWRTVRDATALVSCPHCESWHIGCTFVSGSLWCVWPWYTDEPCLNPHHREYTHD
jgi:hypothetical protein